MTEPYAECHDAENPACLSKAIGYCESHPRIPGVGPPYLATSFTWRGVRYYYVSGRDRAGTPRLIEVFRATLANDIEAVPAFRYPRPLNDLFPSDMAPLHDLMPGRRVVPLTTPSIAGWLRKLRNGDGAQD